MYVKTQKTVMMCIWQSSACAHSSCDTSTHMGPCGSCASHVSGDCSIHGLLEPQLLPIVMRCCLDRSHTCTCSGWSLVYAA